MNGILSADTLFHFTGKKEYLLNILANGFYPRACMENLEFAYEEKYRNSFAPTEVAIPMVCFCDTPLSQIGTHVKEFGRYAIGMSKEWGRSAGINPVMYELPDSNPIKLLRSLLDKSIRYMIGQYFEPEGDNISKIGEEIQYFLNCFLKPYEGNKWNNESNEFDGKLVKFYDEREWRYVPGLKELKVKNIKPFLRKNDFLINDIKQEYNRQLQIFKLGFRPEELKYIIVNTESEVLEIAKAVLQIKDRLGYTEDDKKLLLTKIISIEKIMNDI